MVALATRPFRNPKEKQVEFVLPDGDAVLTMQHLREAHRFNPIIGAVTELVISPSRIEVVAVTPIPCPIEGAPVGSFAHYYVELAFNHVGRPRESTLYMAFGCWVGDEWQASTVQRLHTDLAVLPSKAELASDGVYAVVATAAPVQEQHVVIQAVQERAEPPASAEA